MYVYIYINQSIGLTRTRLLQADMLMKDMRLSNGTTPGGRRKNTPNKSKHTTPFVSSDEPSPPDPTPILPLHSHLGRRAHEGHAPEQRNHSGRPTQKHTKNN